MLPSANRLIKRDLSLKLWEPNRRPLNWSVYPVNAINRSLYNVINLKNSQIKQEVYEPYSTRFDGTQFMNRNFCTGTSRLKPSSRLDLCRSRGPIVCSSNFSNKTLGKQIVLVSVVIFFHEVTRFRRAMFAQQLSTGHCPQHFLAGHFLVTWV